MTTFVAIAAVMVIVACAWVLVPLLRDRRAENVEGYASNLAILRDQLAELDSERSRGVLGDAQYEQAKTELERRVLDEARGPTAEAGAAPRAVTWTAALLGVLLPVGAAVIYVGVGSPEAVSLAGFKEKAQSGKHPMSRNDVEAMVAKLAERMEKDPGNFEGWVTLGRSYYVMQRFPEAARAYARAVEIVPDNADLLADYADTLAVAQGRSLEGKPLEAIERALKLDPGQWKALALAGTAAFDRQDYAKAVAYWERLRTSVPPDSEIARSIGESIAEARALGGLAPPAKAAPADPPTAKVATAKPSPAAAPPAGSPAPSTGPAGARVAGTVRLAPALAARAAPEDTVYIFARAATGPRMPLAILRKQVKDLPASFTLDDSMAMLESLKLSGQSDVVVGARVSRSGSATPQSGDLEGVSAAVKVGTTGIAIVIDSARP